VIKYKRTFGFTIIAGFVTGSFMVVFSSSQQIFQNQYDLKEVSIHFAGLAPIGAAVADECGNKVWDGKLITQPSFIFSGIGDLYSLFYNTPNQMFVFCCCFCNAIFRV
jgi:DHA1 family bicyclomycin/chloramphenicol resistance-like MFS transporter